MATNKPETPTPTTKPDANSNKPNAGAGNKPTKEPVSRMSTEALKAELGKIDNEINSLVTSSLEQMGPGKPFNSATMRQIARHELKKHRLLMNRLAALLKKGHPDVQPIVEKLLTIEI